MSRDQSTTDNDWKVDPMVQDNLEMRYSDWDSERFIKNLPPPKKKKKKKKKQKNIGKL